MSRDCSAEGGREGETGKTRRGGGGVSFHGCAAAVQTRPHQGDLKSAVLLDQFLREVMGGMGEVVSTGPPSPFLPLFRAPTCVTDVT